MLGRCRTYRRSQGLLWAFVLVGMLSPNLNLHFCGGYFSGVSFKTFVGASSANTQCASTKCQKDAQGNCCENVSIEIDQELDGVIYTLSLTDIEIDLYVPKTFVLTASVVTDKIAAITPFYRGPPHPSGYDIRIAYQSFLC